MTQPLNFTAKVIEAMVPPPGPEGVRAGFQYIIEKLRAAQVFVLPDYGTLLDRAHPRPELPGEMYRPPFPVIALEYTASGPGGRMDGEYTAVKSTRRIALAFDWQDDLPPILSAWAPPNLEPGFAVISLSYLDDHDEWVPTPVAMHFAYDGMGRVMDAPTTPFREAMIATGRITKKMLAAGSTVGRLITLMPEPLVQMVGRLGEPALLDMLQADLMDECAAYLDLCCALGCRNVEARRVPAPDKLNRSRARNGRAPLPDHHVLMLGDQMAGGGSGGVFSSNRRPHLRRGHIRRIGAERITWVNQTMVTGQGAFLAKQYTVKGTPRG